MEIKYLIKNIEESNDKISFEHSIDSLLEYILGYLKEFTNSDAGTLYLKNGDRLYFHLSQNDTLLLKKDVDIQKKLEKQYLCLNQQKDFIAVNVAINKEIVNIEDVYNSEEFNFVGTKSFDKKLKYKSHSMLVVPILDPKTNETLSVIQLINKKDILTNKFTSYTSEDEKIALALGKVSAVAILKVQSFINKLQIANLKLQESNDNLQCLNEILEEKVVERTKELEKLTQTDYLTGIKNRRVFFETGNRLFSEDKENRLFVSIIDIDKFKDINDKYGHSIGDRVLREFTDIVNENILKDTLFSRIGGEEFTLIYTDYSQEEILQNLKQIKKLVSEHTIDIDNEMSFKITASFGFSQKRAEDKSLDEILSRADVALYKSKKDGRNKITFRQ